MEQSFQRKIIIGTSGATVIRGRHATFKIYGPEGAEKLKAQVEYVRLLGPPLAQVRGFRGNRYATPTLSPLQGTVLERLMTARDSLGDALWRWPADIPDDWQTDHLRYVAELCTLHRLPWVQAYLREMFFLVVVPDPGLARLTHGDATLDNMLMGKHGPVWIDPLPPSGKVPSFLAVDLGKLLQSARGYEHVKYGSAWPAPDNKDECWDWVLSDLPVSLGQVAHYWYRIHLLRLLRYATPRIKEHAMKELNALCV